MTPRIKLWIAAAVMTAALAVCAGCGSDEPMASAAADNAALQTAPSFADVNRALKLDEGDAAVVKQALAEWQRAAKTATTPRPGFATRRQEMEFVATVAPSLDDAQLTSLVSLLTSRHETHRSQMRAHHSGRKQDGVHMQAVAKELGLDEKQQDALKAVHQETRAKADAQFESFHKSTINEDQLHDALDAIHKDARTKMATILTADQLTKLDAMRDERFENRTNRRVENAGDRTDMHLAWLDRTLELTDAQASQVKVALTTMTDAQATARKAVQGGSLTREQAHEQMRAAHDAFAETLKGILTAEQTQRMEILKPLLPGQIHHA
jgi:hypothetical protein